MDNLSEKLKKGRILEVSVVMSPTRTYSFNNYKDQGAHKAALETFITIRSFYPNEDYAFMLTLEYPKANALNVLCFGGRLSELVKALRTAMMEKEEIKKPNKDYSRWIQWLKNKGKV